MPKTVVKRVGVNFNQWIMLKKNQLGIADITISDTKLSELIIGIELGHITIRKDKNGKTRFVRLI